MKREYVKVFIIQKLAAAIWLRQASKLRREKPILIFEAVEALSGTNHSTSAKCLPRLQGRSFAVSSVRVMALTTNDFYRQSSRTCRSMHTSAALDYLLNSGVKVHMIYGDRDFGQQLCVPLPQAEVQHSPVFELPD